MSTIFALNLPKKFRLVLFLSLLQSYCYNVYPSPLPSKIVDVESASLNLLLSKNPQASGQGESVSSVSILFSGSVFSFFSKQGKGTLSVLSQKCEKDQDISNIIGTVQFTQAG